VKRYRMLLMVTALAVAAPSFAVANEKAKTKTEKADKDKEKDKDAAADKDAAKDKPADPAAPADGATATAEGTTPATPAQDAKDDAVLDPAQPDFTVITMPTTLRLPKYKSAFRVTHRFARPLGDGGLADDFFALDASAQIGLEFRFGIYPGAQIGINRTNDRTIQFFGQYDVKSQSASFPIGISAYATFEGTNNLHDDDDLGIKAQYSPALAAIISRSFSKYAALYVMPAWVNNTADLPSELVDDNSTFLLGVGGRVRVHGTTYFVFEVMPRVSGFDPGVNQVSFGIEKRVGGHSFQMNFSNSIGTTLGQVARGGLKDERGKQDWFLGFNITRKFF
jgi:Membrane bound beta barrel domain (DUF5777)